MGWKEGPRRYHPWKHAALHAFLNSLTLAERERWYEEQHRRREEQRRADQLKIREWIWPGDGYRYFSIPALAKLLGKSYYATWNWAKRRPSLCRRETVRGGKPHLYCRHEPLSPAEGLPSRIEHEGQVYYSIRELAQRRRVHYDTAWRWATRHPELSLRRGGRPYVRDEVRREGPASVVRDGIEYVSIRELARRRGILRATARSWCVKHPELTIDVDGDLYVREVECRHGMAPPIKWCGSVPYYSLREFSRRRGLPRNTLWRWVRKHPHLTIMVNGFWYVRDEEGSREERKCKVHLIPLGHNQ